MLINTSTCADRIKKAKSSLALSVRIDLDSHIFTEFYLSGMKWRVDLKSIYDPVSKPIGRRTSWFVTNVRYKLATDIRGHNLII